jgi:5-carboxymethyl-2-hydroxymuconate isomerase
MPQIILEYSSNIRQKVESGALLGEISSIISAAGDIPVEDFKSRLVRREEFLVGEGGGRDAFVHLEIGLFAGRPHEVKRRIGEDCIEYLEEYFAPSAHELSLQTTVEIREIEKEAYFKAVPGKQGQE